MSFESDEGARIILTQGLDLKRFKTSPATHQPLSPGVVHRSQMR